jgi:hypothetical protein
LTFSFREQSHGASIGEWARARLSRARLAIIRRRLGEFSEEEKRMYAQSYGQPGVMRDAFEYFKAFEPTDAADNRV